MATKICSTVDMSREDWLDIRRKGIGGSDAATCAGLNPWSDKLTLWCDKKGILPEKEDNFFMKIGRDLEDLVAQYFMEETGLKVRKDNSVWRSDEHPYMIANIDRSVVGENAALECKTMNGFSSYDLASGEIPESYYCQCQHYMSVMGYDHMYIAFIQFGKGFFWHRIERNDEDIQTLVDAEGDFWNSYVEADIRPAADGSDSSLATLNKLHPRDNGRAIALSPDIEKVVAAHEETKAAIKRLKDRKDELEATIKEFIGDFTTTESEKWKVTWKVEPRKSVDSKKLQEQYPKVYNDCVKQTHPRVMRIKQAKKKKEAK